MIKYSRQRESIKNFIMTRKDHPTADVVYSGICEQYPKISLATVYRNLALLASMGEIQRLNFGDGIDHFDPNTEPHYHFHCRKCGCIKDIFIKPVSLLDELASEKFDGLVEGHYTVFTGLCRDCMEKENGPMQ